MKDETCAVVQSCRLYCFVELGATVNICVILAQNRKCVPKKCIMRLQSLMCEAFCIYYAALRAAWLVQITHPYVTVCTHPMCRSVWGPLCFSAYAYLVTVKMVSRLCVSLCEAGVESFLFICSPVCLQYIRSTASVLTSSLRPVSLSCSRGRRGSQSEPRPRYATAELTGISSGAECKIPFVW